MKQALRRAIVKFFHEQARPMPWRETRDAYAIWVSEIMLQQTRVATVVPYYQRWMERFPTLRDLARAEQEDVLALWSGLGYYSRARNLHRGARDVDQRYGGELPATVDELRTIPGIGRYTAGAIASQAFGRPAAIVDGNVARVFARLFAIEDDIKSSAGQRRLWQIADDLVPPKHPGEFNQGLMELGATICTPSTPDCASCPVSRHCSAARESRQSELPVTRRRPRASEKRLLHNVGAWIWSRGKVLFAQRKPEGLFGGLWEVPQGASLQTAGAAVGRALIGGEQLYRHEQELSHRRLRIDVYRARVDGRARKVPKDSPYTRTQWMSPTRAAQLGLSTASQVIVELGSKEETWKTATKH